MRHVIAPGSTPFCAMFFMHLDSFVVHGRPVFAKSVLSVDGVVSAQDPAAGARLHAAVEQHTPQGRPAQGPHQRRQHGVSQTGYQSRCILDKLMRMPVSLCCGVSQSGCKSRYHGVSQAGFMWLNTTLLLQPVPADDVKAVGGRAGERVGDVLSAQQAHQGSRVGDDGAVGPLPAHRRRRWRRQDA